MIVVPGLVALNIISREKCGLEKEQTEPLLAGLIACCHNIPERRYIHLELTLIMEVRPNAQARRPQTQNRADHGRAQAHWIQHHLESARAALELKTHRL